MKVTYTNVHTSCIYYFMPQIVARVTVYLYNLASVLDHNGTMPSTINLLQFWTAESSVSGEATLVVDLLVDQTKTLPESGACFNQIRLPCCHTDFHSFKRAMDVALGFGAKGYGRF